eukprot:TRINITY_DN663_c0_g1_i1.p1 TRINITY_DN663_c0_g1~~TRINITY_DN663_c0_g1_i1.p1  ORF type:complete len:184 (+),score=26.70 TRINITY_DN663_c0_g1_i1:163-714(+)
MESENWTYGCNVKSAGPLIHDRICSMFGYFVLKNITPAKRLEQWIRLGFSVGQGGENNKPIHHYTIVFESKFADIIHTHGYRAFMSKVQLASILQDYFYNISNEILERKLEKHEKHIQRWETEVQDIVKLFEEGIVQPLLFELSGHQLNPALQGDPLVFVDPQNIKFEYVPFHYRKDDMLDAV